MKKKLIQFKNIVKSYEDGKVVLKGIDLDIYENEFVTLLGPSGCGKTTLLRILGGFLQADQGEVLFDGQEISKLPPYKREINTVFQKYALFPHMNVYDNLRLEAEKGAEGHHRAEGKAYAQAGKSGGICGQKRHCHVRRSAAANRHCACACQ